MGSLQTDKRVLWPPVHSSSLYVIELLTILTKKSVPTRTQEKKQGMQLYLQRNLHISTNTFAKFFNMLFLILTISGHYLKT